MCDLVSDTTQIQSREIPRMLHKLATPSTPTVRQAHRVIHVQLSTVATSRSAADKGFVHLHFSSPHPAEFFFFLKGGKVKRNYASTHIKSYRWKGNPVFFFAVNTSDLPFDSRASALSYTHTLAPHGSSTMCVCDLTCAECVPKIKGCLQRGKNKCVFVSMWGGHLEQKCSSTCASCSHISWNIYWQMNP